MQKHQRSPSSKQWTCIFRKIFKVLLASNNLILKATDLSPIKKHTGRDLFQLLLITQLDYLVLSHIYNIMQQNHLHLFVAASIFLQERSLAKRIWSTGVCKWPPWFHNMMQASGTKGREQEKMIEMMGRDLRDICQFSFEKRKKLNPLGI